MGQIQLPGMNIQQPKPDTMLLMQALATQTILLDALLRITALGQSPEDVVKTLGLRIPGYNAPLPGQEEVKKDE